MHIYCRRFVIERYCVEHSGMQNCSDLLDETFKNVNMQMTICETKSIIFTNQGFHVCVALTNGSDDDGFTYLLQFTVEQATKILCEIDRYTRYLVFHYIESMSKDLIVTYIEPNNVWLAGSDEKPSLPNTSPYISVDIFKMLIILCKQKSKKIIDQVNRDS